MLANKLKSVGKVQRASPLTAFLPNLSSGGVGFFVISYHGPCTNNASRNIEEPNFFHVGRVGVIHIPQIQVPTVTDMYFILEGA